MTQVDPAQPFAGRVLPNGLMRFVVAARRADGSAGMRSMHTRPLVDAIVHAARSVFMMPRSEVSSSRE